MDTLRFRAPFGRLGSTIHLRLIGKCVPISVDGTVLLDITAEALRAKLD